MSPDDCVEIAEMYAERFFGQTMRTVQHGADRIPAELILEQIAMETGLEEDDVTRFADIGDFIKLDRQLRSMTPDEREEWEQHKQRIVNFVDEVMTEEFIQEVAAKRGKAVAEREMLEEIWNASEEKEKSDEEAVIERAKNITSADTKRLLEMIFEDPSANDNSEQE
jgi:poly-D-alanine transfer protein DltD